MLIWQMILAPRVADPGSFYPTPTSGSLRR
jgi:hypothetical protein